MEKLNNFLSIEEYLKNFNYSYPDYISQRKSHKEQVFPPKVLKHGMLKWEDNSSDHWCGPFPGNYCLLKLTDYTNTCDYLKTISEHLEAEKVYGKYSLYNIPRNSAKQIFKELKEPHFYFPIITLDGQVCSRTQLSHQEYLKFKEEASDEEFQEYENNIIKNSKNQSWHLEIVTKENPISLYLAGTDDTSYTRFFDTVENSLKEFNFLVDMQPSFSYIHKNYIFTN